MSLLEKYLDTQTSIVNDLDYNNFKFDDKELFEDELTFLLDNIYQIKIYDSERQRNKQKEWANKIKQLFNNKCVVSNDTANYLEACHLMEIKDKENYDLDNGIILTKNLHYQFDNNEWCINPFTYEVEVKNNVIGDISGYQGKKLDLPKNYKFMTFLKYRYDQFKKTD